MKTIKHLVLLTVAFGALTLSSCKKDKKQDPAPTGTLTANVDGTATTFNTHAFAGTGTVLGQTFTTIEGVSAAGDTISVTIAGAIKVGKTYSAAIDGSDNEPLFLFTPKTGDQFINDDDSANNKVSLTISSASSTAVEGTFTGDLVENIIVIGNGGPTLAKKSVTNGKFSLAIQTHP
ncbi:hypothetical protein ACPPVU_19915 [Mucilaginibacter sp. McL0603]|uniref:hypothetical protein n=1 Tax=Mucilaginibacter sp. McL0603 TaxID=3415670 RepID=UPI003CF81FC3